MSGKNINKLLLLHRSYYSTGFVVADGVQRPSSSGCELSDITT